MTTWQRAQETLTHLHKTLCLIRNLTTPIPAIERDQNTEKHMNQGVLIQLIIELNRLELTDELFPFVGHDSGVTARLIDGSQRSVAWSQDVRED